MATQTEIEFLLEQLKKTPPSNLFEHIDKNTAGINAVLRYLYESNETVTAGKISKTLQVSTARVAVLLRKMTERDLIKKEYDPSDGRVVVVELSEHGRETAEKIKNNVYAHVGEMIDKVGMERMLEFSKILKELHSGIKPPEINF